MGREQVRKIVEGQAKQIDRAPSGEAAPLQCQTDNLDEGPRDPGRPLCADLPFGARCAKTPG